MQLEFNIYLIPLIMVSVISINLALFAWRSYPSRNIYPFLALSIAIAWWSFGYAMELSCVEMEHKILWAKLEYFSIVALPVTWLFLILHYIGRREWITKRNIAMLFLLPAAILFLVLTNEYHHLVWENIEMVKVASISVLDISHGPAFWLHVIYSYTIIFLTIFILIHAIFSLSHLYRKQYFMLLIGALMPWIGNAMYALGVNPIAPLDITPITLLFSVLAAALAVLRFRFLEIVPVARETLIEDMGDAIIVLDEHNKILDANPAAGKIFGILPSKYVGSFIDEVMRGKGELIKYFKMDRVNEEIAIKDNGAIRYYNIRISPLHDKQGRKIGRLVILRDVTTNKKNEERIKRLNEELKLINKIMRHDIVTDLQIIQGLLEIYRDEKDDELLQKAMKRVEKSMKLIRRMRDAEAIATSGIELKEYNMRQVIEDVVKNYSIEINISGDCTVMADDAIFSVVDNIIRNAIVHGEARKIDVKMEEIGDICKISFADYGKGVPDEVKDKIFQERFSYGERGGSGLGLYIVRKIVESYGGKIYIEDNEPSGAVFIVELKK